MFSLFTKTARSAPSADLSRNVTRPIHLPRPDDGELAVKVLASIPNPAGGAMVMGEIIISRAKNWFAGQMVFGLGAEGDYCLGAAHHFHLLPKIDGMSPEESFALFGDIAPLAYFGLVERAAIRIGETLIVLGADTALGQLAGRLGKACGAQVIGLIDGDVPPPSDGFDHLISISDPMLGALLADHCPKGADVIFDAVGSPWMIDILPFLRPCARIVCARPLQKEVVPEKLISLVVAKGHSLMGVSVTNHLDRFHMMIPLMAELVCGSK